ncbi:MAG TPA: CDC27 family protein, partial [Candidatus Acidoferrales bacterium]|nr:CDC27 family protein [Candidatus Acidoferrales bacterium]
DHLDEVVGLSVMALDAEAEVLAQEGDASAALQIIQTMEARYPKYLLHPEFDEVRRRSRGRRAFFLTALDRWKEAIPLFEHALFADEQLGEAAHYLGYCYYRGGDYVKARGKLVEALSIGVPVKTLPRTHYTLALAEYHLGNMKAAKEHLELCAKTGTPEYLAKTQIWQGLEATSRALGLPAEADEYHKRWATPSSGKIN